MAGIGLIGGIGQALVSGGGGYIQGQDEQRLRDLQAEQLRMEKEDRQRKQEREDFAFDQVKDAAEAEQEQNLDSLYDYARPDLNPWEDLRNIYAKPIRQPKTQNDVDPQAISQGLVEPGNIPLKGRPLIDLGDGRVGSEYSIGIEENGKEVLIPTIYDGERHSAAEAVQHYRETGQHLGKYSSIEAANQAAQIIHSREDKALDDGSIGRLPGTAEPAPRLGKTPALHKMTLGDFAGRSEELMKKIDASEAEYEKHRTKVVADISRIVEETKGNIPLRNRKLSAYYKAMEASPKFKSMQANYTNLMESIKTAKVVDAGIEIMSAIFSGDTEAMQELGLVNADGTPMKVAKDQAGNPVGLVTATGILGQPSIMAFAAMKKGLMTPDDFKKTLLEDLKAETSRNQQAAATQRSSISVSIPKEDSFIRRADEITKLKARLRKEKDPEMRQVLQDNINALEQQIPDNTTKTQQADIKLAQTAVSQAMDEFGWAKTRKPPTVNAVIKQYTTLKSQYGEAIADDFFAKVTGSWSKAGDDIMKNATAYWKNKAAKTRKVNVVSTSGSR